MKAVLCYHRVSNYFDDFNLMNVSIRNFEMHMRYLKEHYEVLPLDQLMNGICNDNGRDQIAVTFDDGYRDVYKNAFPILKKYGIPATAFITTKNIDTTEENWPDLVMRVCMQPAVYHDYFDMENELITLRCNTRNLQERCDFYINAGNICARLDAQARNKQLQELKLWAGLSGEGRESRRILNTEEIRFLAGNPLITIGAHTETHPTLRAMSREEQLCEIRNSKDKLETITGEKINFFAYPYGSKNDYDRVTMELLKSNGYQMAFTTGAEKIETCIDTYQIPRCVVYNYDEAGLVSFFHGIFGKNEKAYESRKAKRRTQLAYAGRLEEDTEILYEKKQIVIWGYGYWGKELYAELKMLGLGARVLAFGDKNIEKCGVTEDEVPVLCMKEIMEMTKISETAILIKGIYDWEIFTELKEKGFENLHIIMR